MCKKEKGVRRHFAGGIIVRTEAALWEWLNAFSDAGTRAVAAEGYRRAHPDARIEVVLFQPELTTSAVQLYGTRLDKSRSLTDCLSFVVMDRRQLTEALTTDRHFEQAGMKAMMLQQPALRV